MTGDPTHSARLAGYAHPQPRGSDNLRKPAIQAEIRAQQLARLHNDLLPLALNTIETALKDPVVPWGSKMVASKIVIDRVYAAGDAAAGKDPAEMSGDELQSAIDRLRREASERAKPILEHEESIPKPGAFD
ncbi:MULTISPECIES: hypothetical protein [unclassified Mesorhizobium]|uniref:hypothetical protein n=1 Tax=unclassified Mesorhizobium TaxID=325217 RepID=UPI000FE03D19|nr:MULTISPECIES: hypothetical protein [unclassified Mesorhizobium]TGT76169.1 hypothetical protein EN809_000655 [Mesorhizobium sp. M2E.F.Ca.ET.166.01.1.1]TGW02284.1 hypothetical protein EN797_000655 [Mesorhizobium sp. M2E.F.Ca.ET.154.01.1.1]